MKEKEIKPGSYEWQRQVIREEYIEPAKKEQEKQTRR